MAVISQLEPWQQQFEQGTVYKFEGYSATMYLDTVGLVTVGRGCQISAAEAQVLPFTFLGRAATPSEIVGDYNRVQSMGKGHTPNFYSTNPAGVCILPAFAIEALCQQRIQSATASVRSIFPQFDTWPDVAKIATVEEVWGLGEYKYRTQYLKMIAALRSDPPDFVTAANECAWADPNGWYRVRNALRKALYMQAAQEMK